MQSERLIYLALGSNLGDRPANLSEARKRLSSKVSILRTSSIYETPPWGVTEQPAFLNQVLETQTDLLPLELLAYVKRIEVEMGRVPSIRFGPRLIDIDILLYGDLLLEESNLVIPHPRLIERAFVLVPLCELAPALHIPGKTKSAQEYLSLLDRHEIVKWEEARD